MAVSGGQLERELESLLEIERFDPPQEFRAHALANDPSIHRCRG